MTTQGDLLTSSQAYEVADKLRELANSLDGGIEGNFDEVEVKDSVTALLGMCSGFVKDDETWNRALRRVLVALGENP